jgi:hypothetical protein
MAGDSHFESQRAKADIVSKRTRRSTFQGLFASGA